MHGATPKIQNPVSFCDKFLVVLLMSLYFYLISLPAYCSSTQRVYVTFEKYNLNLQFPRFHNYRLKEITSLPNLT